jgi:hypothetical protein
MQVYVYMDLDMHAIMVNVCVCVSTLTSVSTCKAILMEVWGTQSSLVIHPSEY